MRHEIDLHIVDFNAFLEGRPYVVLDLVRRKEFEDAKGHRVYLREFAPCAECGGGGRVRSNDGREMEDCGCPPPHGSYSSRVLDATIVEVNVLAGMMILHLKVGEESEKTMSTTTIIKPDLSKLAALDLRGAAKTLNPDEARYLVDLYYQVQEYRIRAGGQVKSAMLATCPSCRKDVPYRIRKRPRHEFLVAAHPVAGEPEVDCPGTDEVVETPKVQPHALVSHVFETFDAVEEEIGEALDAYTESQAIGTWLRSIRGIGPVISAGLIAHVFHVEPFPATVGNLWAFSGLSPEQKWEKGKRRPWNARLKVLAAFKLGESFVKLHKKEDDVYGHLYAKRKVIETEKNERGDFKDQAAASIDKFDKKTEAYKAYKAGKLPKGRIHARARRWAVKIFLSHYWTVCRFMKSTAAEGKMTFEKAQAMLGPQPYAIEHLGHAHVIPIPSVDVVPGLAEALRAAGRKA